MTLEPGEKTLIRPLASLPSEGLVVFGLGHKASYTPTEINELFKSINETAQDLKTTVKPWVAISHDLPKALLDDLTAKLKTHFDSVTVG